jgi:hypothetical protein
MLDSEVPQEGNSTLAGHRKAVYARGDDGKLHIVQSAGWEVEEIVTRQLEYHMHKARMDVPLLSQVTGLWQWRIRRHFRPDIFAGLSAGLLQRYGDAMGLSVEQLKKAE